jgi:hypothetical protein
MGRGKLITQMASQTKRRLESESEPVAQEAKTKKSLKPTRNIFLEAWEELKQEDIKRIQDIEKAWPVVQEVVDFLTFERIRAIKLVSKYHTHAEPSQKLEQGATELALQLAAHLAAPVHETPRTSFYKMDIEERALAIFKRSYPELDDLAQSTLLRRVQDPEWRQIIKTLPQQREELVKLLKQ